MSQLASDDFNRSDSGTLGGNWTRFSDNDLGIFSNQCSWNITGSGFAMSGYTGISWVGVNDQYSEAKIKAGESGRDYGVMVRGTGTTNTNIAAYIFILNEIDAAITLGSSSYQVAIYVSTGGISNFTPLGASVTGVTINANDVIRLEASGTTFTGKINGSTILSRTDSSIASGKPGLYIGGINTPGATAWDDFAAGDVAGGTIMTPAQSALTLTGQGTSLGFAINMPSEA